MSTPYSIVTENLAAIRNGVRIVGTGTVVTSFVVLAFPPATIAFLRLGQSGQRIPLALGLLGSCLVETDGLWLDIPVIGAGDVIIAIFYGPNVPSLSLGT